MGVLRIDVVRRETEKGVQLVFWDDQIGQHRILWAPRKMFKTELRAGMRDFDAEYFHGLTGLRDWQFLIDNERLEFTAIRAKLDADYPRK